MKFTKFLFFLQTINGIFGSKILWSLFIITRNQFRMAKKAAKFRICGKIYDKVCTF